MNTKHFVRAVNKKITREKRNFFAKIIKETKNPASVGYLKFYVAKTNFLIQKHEKSIYFSKYAIQRGRPTPSFCSKQNANPRLISIHAQMHCVLTFVIRNGQLIMEKFGKTVFDFIMSLLPSFSIISCLFRMLSFHQFASYYTLSAFLVITA